mmetsp:Transcript_10512/g.30021  ORF Transcript_10512/g.30021 Transcript_10512/m.30021 type:complete len:155 (-) Transcript_10512:36-500(-)
MDSTFDLRTPGALRRMLLSAPALLSLSIPYNLEPTFEFYVNCFGGNRTTAIEFVTNTPTVLASSLEKRLKPRLAQVVDRYPSVVVETVHGESNGSDGDDDQSAIRVVRLTVGRVHKMALATPPDWNATIASGRFIGSTTMENERVEDDKIHMET